MNRSPKSAVLATLLITMSASATCPFQFQSLSRAYAGVRIDTFACGDFNNDGYVDAIIGNAGGSIVPMLNNGNGTFLRGTSRAVFTEKIAVADFNGDGNQDLAITNSGWRVLILRGNGDGTFRDPVEYTFPNGLVPSSVCSGDFNGDGKPDLAMYVGNAIAIMLGNGNFNASFQPAIFYPAISGQIEVGDFNGDGRSDVAAFGPSGISARLSNPDGSLGAAISSPLIYDNGTATVGDVNRDGRLDLVYVSGATLDVTVSLGNGLGGFTSSRTSYIGTGGTVKMADLNLDRFADLTVLTPGLNGSFLAGNGNGTFDLPVRLNINYGNVLVEDFTGDNKQDLLVVDSDNVRSLANTVCLANFNCDSAVDFFDYLDFVAAFSTLDPEADFNTDDVIDFFDYLDFVQAFASDC